VMEFKGDRNVVSANRTLAPEFLNQTRPDISAPAGDGLGGTPQAPVVIPPQCEIRGPMLLARGLDSLPGIAWLSVEPFAARVLQRNSIFGQPIANSCRTSIQSGGELTNGQAVRHQAHQLGPIKRSPRSVPSRRFILLQIRHLQAFSAYARMDESSKPATRRVNVTPSAEKCAESVKAQRLD